MSEDNKNVAGDSERTSILPQSGTQNAERTEVLPAHAPETETAQMPPVAQEETGNAFAGTPLECVAGSSIDDQASDEAVAGRCTRSVAGSPLRTIRPRPEQGEKPCTR